MAINKVELGSETLMDLTKDTVGPNSLLVGATAHNAAGEEIQGLVPPVSIDTAMSNTSTNPVQNKVIKAYVDENKPEDAILTIKQNGVVIGTFSANASKNIEIELSTPTDYYVKPSGGIPKTDLASSVQTSLGKADTALQTHQDISGKQDKSTAVTHTASTAAGSATQPVYVNANGVATATTYSLGKSVPSDAKFTDTTYSVATTSANGLMSSTDKTKLNGIATGATAVSESTVSGWGFTKNTGTYSKPSTGIPKTDLASDVQTSLGKADTALQSHQDISGKVDKTGDTMTGDLTIETSSPKIVLNGTSNFVAIPLIDFIGKSTDYGTFHTRLTGKYMQYLSEDGSGTKVKFPEKGGTIALTSEIPTSLPANGGTSDNVKYTHTNEINFKGGRQAACHFNYRNADDDTITTKVPCSYYFQSYAGPSYSDSHVYAGTFHGNATSATTSQYSDHTGYVYGGNNWMEMIKTVNMDGYRYVRITLSDSIGTWTRRAFIVFGAAGGTHRFGLVSYQTGSSASSPSAGLTNLAGISRVTAASNYVDVDLGGGVYDHISVIGTVTAGFSLSIHN